MARKPQPTFADYVVIALSPALIMLLVGSLVFFLVEVFYRGDYDSRLTFIMAMFVMAAVLIARISIEESREYATLFAIPLAIVTAIALHRFVEFGGPLRSFSLVINLGLIALIWWCADKLTWDSTVIDESKDASGEGLLQTAGLDSDATTQNAAADAVAAQRKPQLTIWQRFLAYRRRPHSPGVWVIYFSIAALPIFGFGNWFIPGDDLSARRYVFKLLVTYVAAALGLLLTTSFLNLRRYLRQRRLEMPVEMAGAWIGTGAAMIVALLAVCMLLPRRNAEYSVTQLPIFAGSPTDLWTTEYAVGSEGQEDPEKGDRTGEQTSPEGNDPGSDQQDSKDPFQDPESKSEQPSQSESSQEGKSGSPSDQKGQSPQQSSRKQQEQSGKSQESSQQDPSGSNQQQSDSKSGSQSKKSEQSGDPSKQSGDKNQSKSSDSGSPPSEKDPNNQRSSEDKNRSQQKGQKGEQQSSEKQPDGSQSTEPRDPQSKDSKQKSKEQAKNQPSKAQRKSSNQSKPQPQSKFDPSKIPSAIGGTIGGLLKLLYWVIALAIIGYFTWKYWRQIREAIANFWKSLQDFWASLFGRKIPDSAEAAPVAAAAPMAKPFAAFHDPFLTGMAQGKPPVETVRYSFEALEAWAREQGFPRKPEQTPQEFAQQVGAYEASVVREAATLAELYNRCAYSRDLGGRVNIEPLRRLWQRMGEHRAPEQDAVELGH